MNPGCTKPSTLCAVRESFPSVVSMMESLISKSVRKNVLDEALSPRLSLIGLEQVSDYFWVSDFSNGIARVFQYLLLKGGQSTFSWGVCLDFLPLVRSGKLKYAKTRKGAVAHLYQWTKEYGSSFLGGGLEGGVCSEWGEANARRSINALLTKYEGSISDWYETASSLEGLIGLAEFQVAQEAPYSLHSPDPEYVLAFLLAKSGAKAEALKSLTCYLERDRDLRHSEQLRELISEIGA